jgi:hypothetical protein
MDGAEEHHVKSSLPGSENKGWMFPPVSARLIVIKIQAFSYTHTCICRTCFYMWDY